MDEHRLSNNIFYGSLILKTELIDREFNWCLRYLSDWSLGPMIRRSWVPSPGWADIYVSVILKSRTS